MASAPLYGTMASLSTTAWGGHWNAFSISVAQGITSYFGFGDTWMTNYGTISSWSGQCAAFTSHGTSAEVPGTAILATRAGVSQTFTWTSGCTLAGTIILSGADLAVAFLGTDTSAYNFVGTGQPTETWS